MEMRIIEECPSYAVTNSGQVWSFYSNKFLKQKIDRYGYPCVTLHKDGKQLSRTVHRLVATTFIPNPEDKPTVNHKDENKLNNSIDNLEWMTVAENNKYGTHYQRSSETQKGKEIPESTRRKLSEANKDKKLTNEHIEILRVVNTGANSARAKRVRCIETGEVFDCISDAARQYKVDKSLIVKCCKGKSKSAGKHPITGEKLHWEYC